MSDGFLEGAAVEQTPKIAEVPPTGAEVDDVALAEREAVKEMTAEQKEESFLENVAEEAPTTTVATTQTSDQTAPAAAPMAAAKDEVTLEVEKILEDGLGEFVESMPADAQQRFSAKGQEVSGQIANMVRGFRVEVRRVVRLIQEWLQTIPGVNKFFLEQEAKIKTDRILELQQARKEEAQTKIS